MTLSRPIMMASREESNRTSEVTNYKTGNAAIRVMKNGHYVSRTSDFIMYSVEAEYMDRVVAEYGPCMFIRC
jgi:prephenate dehydrogenase (NADP+)